jgi:hypothetical protein
MMFSMRQAKGDSNMAHALDAGFRFSFIFASLARASDAHRSASHSL